MSLGGKHVVVVEQQDPLSLRLVSENPTEALDPGGPRP